MRVYFIYNKNVTIKADGTWMNSAKRLLAARGKIETYCEQLSIFKQILLEYVGVEGISAGVYVYEGNSILLGRTAHVDNYFLFDNDKISKSKWQVGDVAVGDSVVKISEKGKSLTIIKKMLSQMIKYVLFIWGGIWAIIIIKRKGVSISTRLLDRWGRRRKKGIGEKRSHEKPEGKVLSKDDLLRAMKGMEFSKEQKGLSPESFSKDVGSFEKNIVKYVLSSIFTAISEDLAKVKVCTIFDVVSPRIYFKERVLYINAAFCGQEIQDLKKYYMDTKLSDKWKVFRQWMAIALESSLLAAEGEMPLKKKESRYYFKTILLLLRNRKEVLRIFDMFSLEEVVSEGIIKGIEKQFNFSKNEILIHQAV